MGNSYKCGQWYSVTDNEVPSEFDWVLVSPVAWENPKLRLVPMMAELRNGKWASLENDGGDLETWFSVTVTHWMPVIPESPDED